MPNALNDTVELQADSMATYVFAMGDQRGYTRVLFPASIEDRITHLMRPTTVADVLALGGALNAYTESELISVTISLFYDITSVPASDAGIEDTYAILFTNHKTGFQVRIPNCSGPISKQDAATDILPFVRDPETGKIPKGVVNAVPKPDRKARMSV